jgi:hypothetical protein
MKSIDELTKKAEEGYAKGYTEVVPLVRYIAGGEDLPTRLVAGTIAARVINRKGGSAGAGLARDLGKAAQDNAGEKLPDLPDVPDVAGAVMNAVELPTRMLRWLSEPGSWVRIAYVVGGGAMVLVALALVVKGTVSNVAGSEVGKIAGKALKGKG